MEKAKPVASVCFLDNRSISMDVEEVMGIDSGTPMKIADDQWFCEVIIRSAHGTVALQLLADSPDRFVVQAPEPPQVE
ncbi:MAG: hypothetical protein F8N37_19170 [Telmatospirillum sp.]|nr:hypothetical protein [Telmatospirillum sp.]